MSTDPTPQPPADEPAPFEAHRSPLTEGAPRPSDFAPLGRGLVDVLVVAALYIGGSLLVGGLVARWLGVPAVDPEELPPDQWRALILSGTIGSLAGFVMGLAWLRLAVGTAWSEMGWRTHQWPAQMLLGVVTFLVVMIPIFGLQALLNFLYEQLRGEPRQHPLIEHLRDHPDGAAFLIAAFTAVIVAPITEEFLFRGVLQGWLERVAAWMRSRREYPLDSNAPEDAATMPMATRGLLLWPIVVSSLVFALMHYSHGVAWVPLFFFALALGYLFQRTGSLIAPIVLHVSLNATTMLILYLMR